MTSRFAIRRVKGREILDSRGRPTVEAEVELRDGVRGRASVPSGASTGRNEAVELRDGDPSRYEGLGVLRAVANVEGELAAAVRGLDVRDQAGIDAALVAADGTPTKARLGANAVLAVSLACARAAAGALGVSLWRRLARDRRPLMPLPMVNILSGGLHAPGGVTFQDFLAVPVGAASYRQALEMAAAVRSATGRLLAERGLSVLRADEGGFGPPLAANAEAVELLVEAIRRAGLVPGHEVAVAIDVAASHLLDGSRRYVLSPDAPALGAAEVVDLLDEWVGRHPIVSIEDALAEDDLEGWQLLTTRLGERVQLVGDDVFVTNPATVREGIAAGVANAVLVKMNQVGTLTETFETLAVAEQAGYGMVVSARSGETEDSFLADLAVASGAGQIKVGSLTQSERLAKYNRLLRIEEELGGEASFAGSGALRLGATA